ncbi:adenosine deaminase [Corynebacterium sp. c8Ua_181]|uniref:Adenosine deaminase n=2 Tax=Corynebacterium curieae TaxID=2913500 RepID=A0A9X3MDB0_9CORY|nr:adenosine deaminase [Corynebacterium curieae]MCZ9307183.1 adenosine deaminase [Corynebacterium curieae]MDV2423340.1 adenosine deaminase [Corynebacterium curieae]
MGRMHDAPLISPENKDSAADVVAKLPKVSLFETISSTATAPEDLTATIRKRYEALAADGVVYAELHLDPAKFDVDAATLADAAAAARIPSLDARIVLAGTAAETAVSADAPVVGYSLPQGQVGAAADFRADFLPTQILVGEDFAEVERAAQAGVNRLIHPINMIDDFTANIDGILPGKASGFIRDRHIPLVFTPLEESEDLNDHPLPLLQQLGFTCAISSGETTLTNQFLALSEAFGYGLEEFFDLTVKAVENSFADQESRQHLLETVILPAYEELSDPELAGPDTEESLADAAEETTD